MFRDANPAPRVHRHSADMRRGYAGRGRDRGFYPRSAKPADELVYRVRLPTPRFASEIYIRTSLQYCKCLSLYHSAIIPERTAYLRIGGTPKVPSARLMMP